MEIQRRPSSERGGISPQVNRGRGTPPAVRGQRGSPRIRGVRGRGMPPTSASKQPVGCKFCVECGVPRVPGSKFCGECGNRF